MTALFAATAGGASALQKAGSIAAIIGASVAVLLLGAGMIRWWWRRHPVRSVKVLVVDNGPDRFYLRLDGLPASTTEITALVNDGETTNRLGPAQVYSRESSRTFGLGDQISRTAKKYKVEVSTTLVKGEHRRIFKGKVKRGPDEV